MKHIDILSMIDDKLDMKIRDEKIRTTWDVMSHWTKLKYKEKIQYLMSEYHLSLSRIEDIVLAKEEGTGD